MVFVQVVLLAINPYIFYNQSVIDSAFNGTYNIQLLNPIEYDLYDDYDFLLEQLESYSSKELFLTRKLWRNTNVIYYPTRGNLVASSEIGNKVVNFYYRAIVLNDNKLFEFIIDTNFIPPNEAINVLLYQLMYRYVNINPIKYLLDTYLYLYLPTLPTEIVSELMSMNISCSRPWFNGEVISLTRGFRYKIEINRAKNIFIFDTLHYLITTQDLDLSENPGKFEKLLVTIKEVGVNINWPYLYKKAAFYRTNIRYKDLIKAIYAATKYLPIDSEQRDIILYRDR
jgi:hypothetical protein